MGDAPRRVMVFIGTRPEAIKMAPVIRALESADGLEPIVVSTGQHREMLQQVVDLFELPVHHELDVMVPDQTLAGLSSRLFLAIDEVLEQEKPDFVLVQGDTTTVLVAALCAFYRKIPIGHVEAGLRTGNIQNPFPEEANRKLTTPLCDLYFCPTERSKQNLLDERVPVEKIHVTGNTVIDALLIEVERQENDATIQAEIDTTLNQAFAEAQSAKSAVDSPSVNSVPSVANSSSGAYGGGSWRAKPYVLITGHRRENLGSGFDGICDAIAQLDERFQDHRFVYPVHINPRVKGPVEARLGHLPNVLLLEPQTYRPFVALMRHCRIILTDSGGIQEEAPSLGKPVLVLRETTERPEAVDLGTVKLVGTDASVIVEEATRLLTDETAYARMAEAANPYGDGHAAGRVVTSIFEGRVSKMFRKPAAIC